MKNDSKDGQNDIHHTAKVRQQVIEAIYNPQILPLILRQKQIWLHYQRLVNGNVLGPRQNAPDFVKLFNKRGHIVIQKFIISTYEFPFKIYVHILGLPRFWR